MGWWGISDNLWFHKWPFKISIPSLFIISILVLLSTSRQTTLNLPSETILCDSSKSQSFGKRRFCQASRKLVSIELRSAKRSDFRLKALKYFQSVYSLCLFHRTSPPEQDKTVCKLVNLFHLCALKGPTTKEPLTSAFLNSIRV